MGKRQEEKEERLGQMPWVPARDCGFHLNSKERPVQALVGIVLCDSHSFMSWIQLSRLRPKEINLFKDPWVAMALAGFTPRLACSEVLTVTMAWSWSGSTAHSV